MKNLINVFIVSFFVIVAISCKKNSSADDSSLRLEERVKAAPDGFNFATARQVEISVRLLTNANLPIKNVLVKILKPGTTLADGVYLKATSDNNGYVKGTISVPAYLDTLLIEPDYPGLINRVKGAISQNTLTGIIGGDAGYGGNIVAENLPKPVSTTDPKVFLLDLLTGIDFEYPTGFLTTLLAVKSPLNLGVPKYLETTRDVIDQASLDLMSATFPEGSVNNITVKHPELLTSTVNTINVTKSGTVYVTFVSEGATYANCLGYYTYPTSTPPTSVGDINNVTLVFPNASASGSLGGLLAGDKVKLGTFSAGTSIGFILMQNAWTGAGVSVGTQKFYSTTALNVEATASLKRHSIMVYDNIHQTFVVGFEDLNRQTSSSNPDNLVCDNDFNDLLFYVSGGDAISITGVSSISILTDADGDGVSDNDDEFPADPLRAYTETTVWNTIAFEDLWPATGDYDMNDLVVQHRYRYIKNAANNIVEFYGDYKVQAAGAVYNDGFGVEFPFAAGLVKSVTGQQLVHTGLVTLAANGVEVGQTKAVIVPFDDYHTVIPNSSNTKPAINTDASLPKVDGQTVSIKVEFLTPQTAAVVGTAPFNPFLIGNVQRGYEVHLPGKTPTAKADPSLLGTGNDKSNVTTGKYFQTVNNWPWAINIAGTFLHPTEGSAISTAYLHFLDWAQSGGTLYTDWYTNTASGYRNTANIYTK